MQESSKFSVAEKKRRDASIKSRAEGLGYFSVDEMMADFIFMRTVSVGWNEQTKTRFFDKALFTKACNNYFLGATDTEEVKKNLVKLNNNPNLSTKIDMEQVEAILNPVSQQISRLVDLVEEEYKKNPDKLNDKSFLAHVQENIKKISISMAGLVGVVACATLPSTLALALGSSIFMGTVMSLYFSKKEEIPYKKTEVDDIVSNICSGLSKITLGGPKRAEIFGQTQVFTYNNAYERTAPTNPMLAYKALSEYLDKVKTPGKGVMSEWQSLRHALQSERYVRFAKQQETANSKDR